ncbi:hypothetical protein GCM10018980_76450 [Streptomyces capoamus]|uniref:SH3 domain-containing protein n=1 Tax=Streptomyces capoamus TaxID=68183 RepID=A0A919F420_9ACTN|nr:hypothetical protein [Streptomyces capoamus]GGW13118.1 hypothetical protein GCM10010501_15380 [Streptomyces libani subsp. rufus]GHG77897.1 hypothetical protein GCM10018980_76450 [Streptomyces capoamus]
MAATALFVSTAWVPHASASAASGPRFSPCGYQVTGDGVRLHTKPGIGTVLGLLHRGDTVYADKACGSWWRGRLAYDSGSDFGTRETSGLPAGSVGWMAKRYTRAHICLQID